MALNWEATDTYFYVDQENKMMLRRNAENNPHGDNGKGDAIGRTFLSYYLYGDEKFIEGIESCWVRIERKGRLKRFLFGKYYYQGYRYPTQDNRGLSRDHLTYSILAFKYSGYSNKELKEFVKHLRFRISDLTLFTPDLWVWARAICGSKFYTWLFYTFEIPTMWVSKWWNRIIYAIAPFEDEVKQEDFVLVPNNLKPKRLDKLSDMLYPAYALHILSWQLYLLPDSKRKRKLQRICLGIVTKYNYVIKMLLGDKESFTKEEVWEFKAMFGGRWTGYLQPWLNDRDMRIIEDENLIKHNSLDVDYVRKLYNTVTCKDI